MDSWSVHTGLSKPLSWLTPLHVGHLPFILLGLRSVIKEDINATAAELVYGTTIRLPKLSQCTRVFLQHDAFKKPLQTPYDEPFTVVKRSEKLITLQQQGKEICVSIDSQASIHVV
ncbi:transposon Tf2-9 polyprotein [Trichonephila clavipes]|nr:transposon Tf2-9 polyprotein [Trichonephila clavipes]